MEKFKCRECLTLAYMRRLYGKCKTKFQNVKVTLLVVNQRGYMVRLDCMGSGIPGLLHPLLDPLCHLEALTITT